jgi:5-methylcytosine-specific restriction endonuclease McrA
MHTRTLLLNSWYLPTRIIPWEAAIRLKYLGKVDTIAEYKEEVRSPSIVWKMPAVIRMRKEMRYNRRSVKFSREGVYARDKYTCQYCGVKFHSKHLTLDHVIPKSNGGKRNWENIVAACYPCNRLKANMNPDQSGMFPINWPVKPKSLPIAEPYFLIDSIPEEWKGYCVQHV